MSERAFFSLRHAIPGFTLIILVLSINLVPILEKLSEAEVESGIFIGFLSLLSGPAFGFLISQVWWFIFHRLDAEWRLAPDMFNAFLARFKKRKPKCPQLKEKLIPVLDYIVHYEGYTKEYDKEDDRKYSVSKEGIFRYIERRWDLYHILCSELITLWVGFIFGVWPIRLLLFGSVAWTNMDNKILMIVTSIVVILTPFLLSGRSRVRSEHNALSAAIVKSSRLEWKELANIFPVLNELETISD